MRGFYRVTSSGFPVKCIKDDNLAKSIAEQDIYTVSPIRPSPILGK